MLSMLSLRLQQQRLNIREVWTKRVCCKVSGREPALGFGLGDNEKFQARLKRAEEDVWKSGHCSASTWRLQSNNKGQKGRCAYEACLVAEAPSGPSRVFNEQLYQLLLKGAEDSKELKRSVKQLLRDWNRKEAFAVGLMWKQVLKIAMPTTLTISESTAVLITSTRNWQMDFLLGFIFLVASMLPLAKAVQERRRLKSLIDKIPIWTHFATDILLVECAVVGTITSLFIHEGGAGITRLRDFMLDGAISLLGLVDSMNLGIETIGHLEEKLRSKGYGELPEQFSELVETLSLSAIDLATGLAAPLMVTGANGAFLVLFVSAVLFFCSLSTILIRKTSVAQQMPWLTQWNAAIGGPLHLLGSVKDDEVEALRLRVQGQIVLRGFLLTLFLGIFVFPVRSIDAALVAALVLHKPISRTPWVLSWFALWGFHMVTGIHAVNLISENQALRDEDRWLRDMEAYGACGVHSQGPGMGIKPQGLPNTPAIPQSARPGLQVPQAPPPGLQVPQAAPGAHIPPGPPGMQAQQP